MNIFFLQFSPKMPYFDQIEAINEIDKIYVNKPITEVIFDTVSRKIFFVPPNNIDLWRQFGPKNDPIFT